MQNKVNKILKCFDADVTATQAAILVGVQRKTINQWFHQFRVWIAEHQEGEIKRSAGEFELDESYFGDIKKKTHARQRRKRGSGAENKIPVFGIKKREDGSVYTQIIPHASKSMLFPIIKKLITKDDSVIYGDKFRTYDGLVFDGYKHYCINHSKKYSNRRGNHINGIENFWGYAKQRLAKFHGLNRKHFYLHLKECEFRYNRKTDTLKLLRTKLKEMVL